MEIKGTTLYTLELFRKFNRFHVMKSKTEAVLLFIIEAFLLFVFVVMCLYGNVSENSTGMLFLAVLILLLPLMLFVVPWIAARNQKNLTGIENNFIFTEEGLTVFSKGSNIDSKAEMKYELFYRVYETSDSFYIYQTKMNAYPLLKKDVEENRIDDLRNLLVSKLAKGKYKRR